MPLTRNETKVLFGAANSVSIGVAGSNISDTITLDTTCVDAAITVKADNAGTPVAGDTVDVYVLLSAGDPDGAAVADEFASADGVHSQFLCQLDTNTSDPAAATVQYPAVPQAGKLYAVNNGASSVTFSAVIEELRSS